MLVEPIPPGTLLIDTDQKITLAMARAIASAVDRRGRPRGIAGILRYVGLGSSSAQDLTPGETTDIVEGAGLGLLAVQHVRYSPWTPTTALGASDGRAAVDNAMHAGLMKGASILWDLEGVAPTAKPSDTLAMGNAWCSVVQPFSPEAGCYVGYEPSLSATQLQHDLAFHRYARSCSYGVPEPLPRGFCLYQLPPGNFTFEQAPHNALLKKRVHGQFSLALPTGTLRVDYQTAGIDQWGGTLAWMVPGAAAATAPTPQAA